MQHKYTILALDTGPRSHYQFGMSNLRAIRERSGLSQAELADLVGTSQPQIYRLEKGERELTVAWAKRLAPHLGATPEEILFPPESMPADAPSSYAEIGNRLTRLRWVANITQAEMADKLGMNAAGRWANYERGTSRIPVDEALKLVEQFAVSLDWIYYGNRAMLPWHLVEKLNAVEASPPSPVKKRIKRKSG